MKIIVLLVLCAFLYNNILSQNLVPNPSFEETNKLNNIWMRKVSQFDESVIAWSSPTLTIPDLISLQVNEKFWANPNNRKQSSGSQLPRTGNNMIGIRTFGEGDDGAVACWHEYIQVKLTKELKPGKDYYIEFWVSDAIRGVRSANNIGAYFSHNKIFTDSRLPIYLTPHINYCKIIEETSWLKISGFYTPDSAKNYLLIGNFYPDQQSLAIKKQGSIQGAYYYIDDILVTEKTAEQIATGCKPETVIIPAEIEPEEINIPDITTTETNIEEINFNVGETIKMDNIFFETDKAKLLPESIKELDILATTLNKHPNLKIEINGHTDNVGTNEYNLKLSNSRAKAVVDYLISKDISENRLTYKGYGSTKPIATNKTKEGRKTNRRVEFKITGK